MSWFFMKKYGETVVSRMTLNEMLSLRSEIVDLFANYDVMESGTSDFFGHSNFLIPNPTTEKKDYWDIDMFFVCDKSEETETLLWILWSKWQVLDTNKNDQLYSLLFKSEATGNNHQVDFHIVRNKERFVNQVFDYYRVPYFMFLLGLFFYAVWLRIWTNWVLIKIETEYWTEFFKFEENLERFLQNVLKFDTKKIFAIDSFQGIIDAYNESWISEYDFTSKLKSEYRLKINGNDNVRYLVESMRTPTREIEEAYSTFREIVLSSYKDTIDSVVNDFIESKKETIRQNEEHRTKLKFIFQTDDLSTLSSDRKVLIWTVSKDIDTYYENALNWIYV